MTQFQRSECRDFIKNNTSICNVMKYILSLDQFLFRFLLRERVLYIYIYTVVMIVLACSKNILLTYKMSISLIFYNIRCYLIPKLQKCTIIFAYILCIYSYLFKLYFDNKLSYRSNSSLKVP